MRRIALCVVLLCIGCRTTAKAPMDAASTGGVAQLPPISSAEFYSKRIMSGRIPVVGDATVTDEGLELARQHLEKVLHDAPRLRKNLEEGGYELHVQALREFASDLPEYRTKRGDKLSSGQLFDSHMIGGHLSEQTEHFSSCTEGTLLPIVGHKLFGDETCFHELAHAIDWFALDGAARGRVVAAFARSIDSSHWRNEYASTSPHEWVAEITKLYFRADRADLAFYDPSLTRGHRWLCSYDPDACQFAADLYSDRLDPGSPQPVAVTLGFAAGEDALRSLESKIPTRVIVRNHSARTIRVVWRDFRGQRSAKPTVIPPGADGAVFSWATHAFVITDETGRALATFVVPEEEGLVDVDDSTGSESGRPDSTASR